TIASDWSAASPDAVMRTLTRVAHNLSQSYAASFKSRSLSGDVTMPACCHARRSLGVPIAEFERARIQERVRAGLARVRAQGVRLGRPRRRIDPERLAAVAGLPAREAARRLGIPRSTFQRLAQKPTEIDG